MNLAALRSRVRKLSGILLTELLSDTELDQVVNESYRHITTLADWSFVEAKQDLSTAVGVSVYTLGPPVATPRSVSYKSGALRGLLRLRSSEELDRYPAHESADAAPWAWAVETDQAIRLHPTPDAIYALRVRGIERVNALSADTDLPAFSEEYHPVIALDTAARVLEEEGDDSGRADRYRAEAVSYLLRMGRRYLVGDEDVAASAYLAGRGPAAEEG